jgi:hypothetical protein
MEHVRELPELPMEMIIKQLLISLIANLEVIYLNQVIILNLESMKYILVRR